MDIDEELLSDPNELGKVIARRWPMKVSRDEMSPSLIQWLVDNAVVKCDSGGQGGSIYCIGVVVLGDRTVHFSHAIFDPDDWPDHFTYGLEADRIVRNKSK